MEQLSINCQKREPTVNPRALRRQGQLPAVLYGHQGAESVSLTVNTKDAEAIVRYAAINNTLIQVNVPDMSWSGQALLREVQAHPWKGELYHVSFFSVAAQDEVEVEVPLNFTGTPMGVKDEGGTLDILVNEMAIKCAPDNIPETLDIDVSNLSVSDSLHIGDLVLPEGITAVADASKAVVTVLAPSQTAAVSAEAEAAEAEAADETEVIQELPE